MSRFRFRLRHLLGLSLVAALSLGALGVNSAAAQTSASDTVKATELFKSGKAAFGRGDMAEAERLFSQAFAIRKSSDIAANLAQSELEQEKYRAAAEHFSWALANLLPSASDAQRKAVETGLAKARSEVASLRLDIRPEGSDVLVGAQALGKSPLASSIFVDAGEVIISVKHDGYIAVDKRVLVAKGTEQAVQIELFPDEPRVPPNPTAAPAAASAAANEQFIPPVDADASHQKSIVPALITTGVAVAGGVTGLVFTLSANSKEDDADSLRDRLNQMGGCGGGATSADCDELKQQRDSVDSSRNLAIGSFVVGGVAALVAGYLYWDALSASSPSGDARQRAQRCAIAPSFSLERGRGAASSAVESVQLGVSGSF